MLTQAVAIVAGLLAQQKAPQDPDFKWLQNWGISIRKPPKIEEWEFKENGKHVTTAQLACAHRVDDLTIDILVSEPAGTSGLTAFYYDPKNQIERDWNTFASNPRYKEPQKKESKSTKIAGVNAYYFVATAKDQQDQAIEWRQYCWVGRQNQCLYQMFIVSGEGLYGKHQRDISFILGSIQTYKLPKK